MPSTHLEVKKTSSLTQRLAIGGIVAVGLAWVCRDFLWQAIQAFMLNVLPIVFTPIILELSVGFAGLFIVLLFCRMRKKDRDGEWVEFSAAEVEAAKAIETPKASERKVASAPALDEELMQSVRSLLQDGQLAAADAKLLAADEATQKNPIYVRQRLLVTLQLEKWAEARDYADLWPGGREMLALVCVDAARSFIKQKPAHKEAATVCLDLGKHLSVGAVANAIDSDGALQKLA
ncbi:MAG: hypothetical protein ACI8XO_001203 [Verrucomicrobiales bacterium]|jgi:hypothetical protein